MNVRDMFTTPQTAASRRVAELARRLEELKKERRDVQAAASAADVAEKAAADALATAEARHKALGGEQKMVDAARRQLAKAQKDAAGHGDEARLLTAAVGVVEQELADHAARNASSLEKEIRADAEQSAARLVAAIEEMKAAHDGYVVVGLRSVELQRIIDIDVLRTTRVPDLPAPLTEFTRRAAECARAVRLPVLAGPAAVVSGAELRRVAEEAA